MEIVSTRKWNAMHNGVYLIVSGKSKPNKYLIDPKRDLYTKEGIHLTKVNPAFMTRLISNVLQKTQSIEFRITSLKPLNPSNTPDPWEKESLKKFRKSTKEVTFIRKGKTSYFRYMAPLKTEKACMNCHAKQGYKIGDIRGGISVTFPYTAYQKSMATIKKWLILFHTLIMISGVGIILSLGILLYRNVKKLEGAHSEIETLSGLIPICSNCKKIKDSKGYWKQVDSYLADQASVSFSHGLCEECTEKLYGNEEWYKKSKETRKSDKE